MRIACLQFNPQVGDVDNNLTRADRVLSMANPENLDLIVLPEMAFSGYAFKSLSEIYPYLEPTGAGVSSLWARTTALKHNCHVVVGYPEKVNVAHKWPTAPEYFNSAIVIGPDGDNVGHYRKSHLYYTDEKWALEGNKGFFADHVTGLGQTAIGICMDLNPYKFQAPWTDFEFGYHVLKSDANLVIVTMAWCTFDDQGLFSSMPQEPHMDSLTWWVQRLEPVIRNESGDEVIVVFCNRCGSEDDTLYVGTSAVIGIKDGEVSVYGLLGRGDKKLLVVDTNQPPFAKLTLAQQQGGASQVQSGSGDSGNSAVPEAGGANKPAAANPNTGIVDPESSSHTQTSRPQKTPTPPASHTRKSPQKERETSRRREAAPSPKPAYEQPARRETASRPSPSPAPPPAAPRGVFPSLTPEAPRKGRLPMPKLKIPETGSQSWIRGDERHSAVGAAPSGPGYTPIHKRAPHSALAQDPPPRVPSRLPDSAVVVSAVEFPSHARNGLLSPGDSAIGRATPDFHNKTVAGHRKSSRRSGGRNGEVLPPPRRARDSGPQSTNIDALVIEEEEGEVAKMMTPGAFKDSPISRRPNSSILTNWLEGLPPVMPDVPGESPSRVSPSRGSPSRTSLSQPKTPIPIALVEARETEVGSPVCHHCGQMMPASGDEALRGDHKLKLGNEGQEHSPPIVRDENGTAHGVKDHAGTPSKHNGPEMLLLAPTTYQAGAGAATEEDSMSIKVSFEDPQATQNQDEGLTSIDQVLGDPAKTNPAPAAAPLDNRSTRLFTINLSALAEPDGAVGPAPGAQVGTDVVGDPLAPRNRVVPPSVKERPAVVVVRPTSVAW